MDEQREGFLEATLPPGDFPALEDVVAITRFDEAIEILRSPKMRPGQGTTSIRVEIDEAGNVAFASGTKSAPRSGARLRSDASWDDLFRRGVLSHIHGETHTRRRR